jgi:hypothetical protein
VNENQPVPTTLTERDRFLGGFFGPTVVAFETVGWIRGGPTDVKTMESTRFTRSMTRNITES